MRAETKAKLIERVKSLQGLTDDERGDLLELLRTNKTYGLVWENHKEDVEERLRDELPVLIEDVSKRILPPLIRWLIVAYKNLQTTSSSRATTSKH